MLNRESKRSEKTTPQVNPETIERIRRECDSSKLLIAKGCAYSRNDYQTMLNNNVLIVGGSGTGKTRTIVTPNLLECTGSQFVCAPKGGFVRRYGDRLREMGHNVVSLDFTHPEKSLRYNPLVNIRSTQDILRIANVIVDEKASLGTKADPFWDSMTIIFIASLIGYMVETDYHPKNFAGLLQLSREGNRPDDDRHYSPLARRFDELKRKNPHSWACQQFDDVNQSPTRTYDTIRATTAAKFAKLDTEELRILMSANDFDFKQAAREKTTVFVTVSDTDRSMDVLVNLFFTQAMQELCEFADTETEDGRLPIPVNFILDDFATICRIDEFPRIISTIRSRGISAMLMIQSEAQLLHSYEHDYMTVIGNCDTYVYLGGNDVATAQAVSRRCNKTMNQVLNMPVGSCWVFRRGEAPVFTKLLDPDEYIREGDR